jgi:serine/threonine protein kinase
VSAAPLPHCKSVTSWAGELVRRLIFQLCQAIEWCHQHDVVHRDIKVHPLSQPNKTKQNKTKQNKTKQNRIGTAAAPPSSHLVRLRADDALPAQPENLLINTQDHSLKVMARGWTIG